MKRLIAACSLLLFCLSATVGAQTFPSKPVRLVVPNAPGGPSDLVARLLSERLSRAWGQPVVVDNKVGAGGNIGVDAVAKASPDGHTLLLTNSAPIVVNQSLYASMPYNPATDLAPISLLVRVPNVLVVPAKSEINNVADLIRLAKASPGRLTFASLGNGTAAHLGAELLKAQAGVNLLHVPYRSEAQVYAALMVDDVSLYIAPPNVFAQTQGGRLKAIAVTGKTRLESAPQLPTVAESGLPEYEMGSWYGLMAPAGTPPAAIQAIHRDVLQAIADPALKGRLQEMGFERVGSTPAEFSAYTKAESARWAKLIAAHGIKAN